MDKDKMEMGTEPETGCLCGGCKKKGCEMMQKKEEKPGSFQGAMNKAEEKADKRWVKPEEE